MKKEEEGEKRERMRREEGTDTEKEKGEKWNINTGR